LSKQIKNFETSLFEDWCDEVNKKISDSKNPLGLKMAGRLMEIEKKSGEVIVNYSESLVVLIKEARIF